MTFPQTALTDRDEPSSFVQSDPVSIAITNDNRVENTEYIQMRIVRTSDSIRVRIGRRDTARVIITDDDSEFTFMYIRKLVLKQLTLLHANLLYQ